jgi:hypothetical protein
MAIIIGESGISSAGEYQLKASNNGENNESGSYRISNG